MHTSNVSEHRTLHTGDLAETSLSVAGTCLATVEITRQMAGIDLRPSKYVCAHALEES